ncbi:22206_t:CDS:2, partial [Cetraspora pellucida]
STKILTWFGTENRTKEGNVFEKVDKSKVLVENEKTVLKKNGIVVLDDSEEDEKT